MQLPPELFAEWLAEALRSFPVGPSGDAAYVARRAYATGADAQLEACVEWLEQNCGRREIPASLRAAMRPKPPSLIKQQALEALGPEPRPKPVSDESFKMSNAGEIKRHQLIRQALELIPDDH